MVMNATQMSGITILLIIEEESERCVDSFINKIKSRTRNRFKSYKKYIENATLVKSDKDGNISTLGFAIKP